MLKISPSSLNLYLECPRCFWLRFNKKIYRPQGPFSSLPGGVDYTLKNHFDRYRSEGLPPQLKGQIKGTLLADTELVNKMRKPSFGFTVKKDTWFGGALDDVLKLDDGSLVPLDNKTKGFPPKESHWTHKVQMGAYTLIMKEKEFPTKNLAYLVHWFFDHKNMDKDDPLGFNVAVEELETNPDEIKEKILGAVDCLAGEMPPPGENSGKDGNEPCSFCKYREIKI